MSDATKRFRSQSRFVDLPAGLSPPDLTVDETCAYRRESRWTVFRKIREGVYQSYRDGRVRKIIFSSVTADREHSIARSAPSTGKRRPGRPKHPKEQPLTAAE